jgi:hypothetical protein
MAQINTAAGVGRAVCCTAVHCAAVLSARYASALATYIHTYIHTYVHTFHGTESLTQDNRMWDRS